MGKLVLFKPKANATAKENLVAFIKLGKSLTALNARGQFDQDVWSVDHVFGRGKNFYFSGTDGVVFPEPFRSFAKSLLAYQHSFEPNRGAGVLEEAIYALRALVAVCTKMPDFNFEDLSGHHFDLAIDNVKKGNLNIATKARRGAGLARLAAFLSENMLVVGPLVWTNPIPKPISLADSSKSGSDEVRAKRLPSKAAMDAIPQIFFLAHENGQGESMAQVATSYCVLLMSNPSRAVELLDQPSDILVENFSKENNGLGLRWWPEKGGAPIVKPVLGPFEDVVRKAHQSLVENSAKARQVAKWYEENPRKIFLPNDCAYLRGKKMVSVDDISLLFYGVQDDLNAYNSLTLWLKNHGVKPVKRRKMTDNQNHRIEYDFKEVEASVLAELPKDLLTRPSGRKYSEMLFIAEGLAFRGAWSGVRVLFCQISYTSIHNVLGGGTKSGSKSIFDLYGFSNEDGSPIRINTHQFRHWLNTLAQLSGVSQIDIAMWSGRKNVVQNEVYNHITPEQRLERLRSQVGDRTKASGALSSMPKVIPIKRAEYAAAKIPTAHVTDFGYCIHDFSFEPCQLHRDCLSCNDHVCVKGDKAAEDRLGLKLEETKRLLAEAEAAMGAEEYGADRWVEHNKAVLERLVALSGILADPSIENGAIIQMSNPNAPSRLKEAIASRVKMELPKSKGVLIHEQENAKRVEKIKSEKASKGKGSKSSEFGR